MSSESLADISQRDWIRACSKLGIITLLDRGKGGHILIKHPRDNSKYTIPSNLHRIINIKIFKKLESWGFSDTQIFEALR